jgi:hypothetical protein
LGRSRLATAPRGDLQAVQGQAVCGKADRRCGTMTHNYKRNGTTCLFAALNVLEGKVSRHNWKADQHPTIKYSRVSRFFEKSGRKMNIDLKMENSNLSSSIPFARISQLKMP